MWTRSPRVPYRHVPGGSNHSQNIFIEEGASFLLLDQVESYDNGDPSDRCDTRSTGFTSSPPTCRSRTRFSATTRTATGAQFYNGGSATTPRLMVANSTFHNNFASGILVHGDEDNVRFENLIITDHYRRGNSSWGIESTPPRPGAHRAACSTTSSTTTTTRTTGPRPPGGRSRTSRPPIHAM